jgi:aryl-alcohol dehydrogenase-like predicted oxidoreductase
MNYSTLGRSDLRVSEIGFGCMSLEQNQNDNTHLIHQAIDHGINFFDTADRYDKGWNETTLGHALKGKRDDVIIATKVGHQWNESDGAWEWRPTKQHILKAVDQSLGRLQTDRIDLYQLHGGTIDDPIDEIIDAFEILKKKGKIRFYGISSIRPNVIREYAERADIVSVMMQYSLLDRRPEEYCLGMLEDSDISVIARGSLAKGLLIDKPPSSCFGYDQEDVAAMQKALDETGNAIGASIQFVLQQPAISVAAVGIRTEKQLKEVLNAYSLKVSKVHLEKLAGMLKANVYEKHRLIQ